MIDAAPSRFAWRSEPDTSFGSVVSECIVATPATEADSAPGWTIAIPTFRRPTLLVETVRSILSQTDRTDIEILIVDNDPESDGAASLLDALPELVDARFRYYRNPTNLGMFGNWNACLSLALGPWVSILNDDDLLDSDFVATMRRVARRDPSIDAMICSYRFMDCRPGGDGSAPVPARERVRNVFRFGWRDIRRIKARDLFFGSITGSSLGLVVRRNVALAIGGFRSAEYPSADYYFAARLARDHNFVQSRHALAITRIAENESARPETLIGFIQRQGDLQNALLEREAPAWWRLFQAPSLHMALVHLNHFWRCSLDEQDVSRITGHRLSARGTRVTRLYRLLRGAI